MIACSSQDVFDPRRLRWWQLNPRVRILAALAVMLSSSCDRTIKLKTPVAPSAGTPSFLDLQQGWRLRLVVPILQSGKTTANLHPVGANGTVLTFSSQDFIGYETQTFRLVGRKLLRIRLATADLNVNGSSEREEKPLKNTLRSPEFAGFMRLLYLERVSATDHDMALLAATSRAALNDLTTSVQHDPTACVAAVWRFCWWIPSGVAVIAEKRASAPSEEQARWIPAE